MNSHSVMSERFRRGGPPHTRRGDPRAVRVLHVASPGARRRDPRIACLLLATVVSVEDEKSLRAAASGPDLVLRDPRHRQREGSRLETGPSPIDASTEVRDQDGFGHAQRPLCRPPSSRVPAGTCGCVLRVAEQPRLQIRCSDQQTTATSGRLTRAQRAGSGSHSCSRWPKPRRSPDAPRARSVARSGGVVGSRDCDLHVGQAAGRRPPAIGFRRGLRLASKCANGSSARRHDASRSRQDSPYRLCCVLIRAAPSKGV